MQDFDEKTMIDLLRQLDQNWDGMSYDVIWDLCDIMKKGQYMESAEIIDLKMQELVSKNMFNHEATYKGIWEIYQYLIEHEHHVTADSLRMTLLGLKEKGFAVKPNLN